MHSFWLCEKNLYIRIHFDQTSNIHHYIDLKNIIKFSIEEGFYASLYMLMEVRWGKGRLGG